jgi:hypothetical protein
LLCGKWFGKEKHDQGLKSAPPAPFGITLFLSHFGSFKYVRIRRR